MHVYDFNETTHETATPAYSTTARSLFAGEQLELERLHFKPNQGAAEHAHPNEQIMYVITGKLQVRFGQEIGEIGPGQAFLAPANVKHQVTALEDSEVISCKNVVTGYAYQR